VSAAAPDARSGLSRAVVWTGIALGTCLAVLAISDGAVLRIGGLPSWLGVLLGALIVWALIAAASVAVAELVRRHHKTAARYAIRQGRRGAAAAGRGARRHGGRLAAAAVSRAAERWQRRRPGSLMLTRVLAGDPAGPAEVPGEPAIPPAPDSPGTETPRRVCAACGNSENGPRRGGGTWGPLVVHHDQDDGEDRLIHRAHFEDESTGYYGEPYQAAPAPSDPANPNETGGNTMTDNRGQASRITPARRARGAAARAGGTMPAAWNTVIARTADFEPESDGDLLDWMGDEVAAVAAYAEALVDLYESCTQGIGLDPVAMTALHDVADAQAHASETMSGARRKFADHYDRPREFAAEGGLMPHDGRWVTGEGEA
jgi:hypothetical protein